MTQPTDIFDASPFKSNERLYSVVPVQFRLSFIKHDVDAQLLQLRPNDDVIVDTGRGPAIAKVTGHMTRQVLAQEGMMQVIRKATPDDIDQAERNEVLEHESYHFCVARIQERELAMKVVRAQVMQDGSRIVIYFSSDGRIDFRELVKDMAHHFRTRIEMHQIGVRDGTRMIGGIGPCGRELCCSTFLEDFAPVSIRMAKDQGLTLNPAKVSGMCGRLMCCLVYEQAVYRRMKKGLPRAGKDVNTPDGPARVLDIDVINQRVYVQLEDTNRRTYSVEDVSTPGEDQSSPAPSAPVYLWDDDLVDQGAQSLPKLRKRREEADEQPKRSRRRKAKVEDNSKAPKASEPKQPTTDAAKASTDGPKRKRRRRRRSGNSGEPSSSSDKD